MKKLSNVDKGVDHGAMEQSNFVCSSSKCTGYKAEGTYSVV